MQEYKIKSTGFEMYKSTKAQYYVFRITGVKDYKCMEVPENRICTVV